MIYLYHAATNSYRDAGEYTENPPFPAPEGFTWEEGRPEGLEPYQELLLSDALTAKFNELIDNHLGQAYLTIEVADQIAKTVSAVLSIVDNPALTLLAQAPIVTLPLPEEMQADRDAILALFPPI